MWKNHVKDYFKERHFFKYLKNRENIKYLFSTNLSLFCIFVKAFQDSVIPSLDDLNYLFHNYEIPRKNSSKGVVFHKSVIFLHLASRIK